MAFHTPRSRRYVDSCGTHVGYLKLRRAHSYWFSQIKLLVAFLDLQRVMGTRGKLMATFRKLRIILDIRTPDLHRSHVGLPRYWFIKSNSLTLTWTYQKWGPQAANWGTTLTQRPHNFHGNNNNAEIGKLVACVSAFHTLLAAHLSHVSFPMFFYNNFEIFIIIKYHIDYNFEILKSINKE